MKTKLTLAIAFLALLGAGIAAIPPQEKADRVMESPTQPGKKKAGKECKTSDECRRHHRCEKLGEKSVCVAPELREIPKT